MKASRAAHAIAVTALVLGAVLVPAVAQAEIYRWVDATGTVTYGNLPPPPGVKITEVIPEIPVDPAARAEADRERALSLREDMLRLRELEQAAAQRAYVDFPAPVNYTSACNDPYACGTYPVGGYWGPLLVQRGPHPYHRVARGMALSHGGGTRGPAGSSHPRR